MDYADQFSNDAISYTLEESVLEISFSDALIRNVALQSISEVVPLAETDANVRATVIRLYATHEDLEDSNALPTHLEHRQPQGSHGSGPLLVQNALGALFAANKPQIAVLDGAVDGLSLDLATACDLRIASESLKICDTRVERGEAASTGVSYLLPKLIGQSQAMRILLLGDTLDAEEAHRIHLVHRVFNDADFGEQAEQFIQSVARMATRAWQVHKMQVHGQMHLDFESAMVHSLGIRQTHVINDRLEGMKAWRERRPPNFTGT